MTTNYLTPDIYFERIVRDERYRALARAKLNVPVFLGIAERGPVQEPVRISDWEGFKRLFGDYLPNAYLAHTVYGFFNNGGSECFVTRVARTQDGDSERNASKATTLLRDLYSRPTIQVDALSEGSWGNRVKVAVGVPKRVHNTIVRSDLVKGSTAAQVEAAKGFEVGSLVRLTDGRQEAFVQVDALGRGEIQWSQPLKVDLDQGRVTAEAVEYKLTVAGAKSFEIFDNLSMDPRHSRYFAKVVNERSTLTRLTDLRSGTDAPYNMPQPMVESVLDGGRDGLGHLTPEDYIGHSKGPGDRSGLMAYEENDDIGLVCIPDLMQSASSSRGFRGEQDIYAVQQAAVDLAERKRYVHVILDPPKGLSPLQMQEYRERFDTRHAAMYYPWIRVLDVSGEATVLIPPCGHVAGTYAKLDDSVGVHKPPANEPLNDVVGLGREIDKDVQDLLYPDGINCIRSFRGRGIRVWGARTLSSDSQWRHINVSRVFAMICKSVEAGTQWAPFEHNGPELWKMLVRLVGTFLTDMWREGYLLGEIPEKAFYVKCDEETNPPEGRDAGEVVCQVGIAIVRPLEFIVFRVGQRTSDIVLEEPV